MSEVPLYSKVDMLGVWHESVDFGAEKSLVYDPSNCTTVQLAVHLYNSIYNYTTVQLNVQLYESIYNCATYSTPVQITAHVYK